jgi:hypothetical protein
MKEVNDLTNAENKLHVSRMNEKVLEVKDLKKDLNTFQASSEKFKTEAANVNQLLDEALNHVKGT